MTKEPKKTRIKLASSLKLKKEYIQPGTMVELDEDFLAANPHLDADGDTHLEGLSRYAGERATVERQKAKAALAKRRRAAIIQGKSGLPEVVEEEDEPKGKGKGK